MKNLLNSQEFLLQIFIHKYLNKNKMLNGKGLAQVLKQFACTFQNFAFPQSTYEFVNSLHRSGQDWPLITLYQCLEFLKLDEKKLIALARVIEFEMEASSQKIEVQHKKTTEQVYKEYEQLPKQKIKALSSVQQNLSNK